MEIEVSHKKATKMFFKAKSHEIPNHLGFRRVQQRTLRRTKVCGEKLVEKMCSNDWDGICNHHTGDHLLRFEMANILGKFKVLREKWGGEVQQMIQFLGHTRAWNLNGGIGMMAFFPILNDDLERQKS